jgi:hypothetical protein
MESIRMTFLSFRGKTERLSRRMSQCHSGEPICELVCRECLHLFGLRSWNDGIKEIEKYSNLPSSYLFQPLAFETFGSLNSSGIDFITDLGYRLKQSSGQIRSGEYFYFSVFMWTCSISMQLPSKAASPWRLRSNNVTPAVLDYALNRRELRYREIKIIIIIIIILILII